MLKAEVGRLLRLSDGAVTQEMHLEIQRLEMEMGIGYEREKAVLETWRIALLSKEELLKTEKDQHCQTQEQMSTLQAQVNQAKSAQADAENKLGRVVKELKNIRPYVGRGLASKQVEGQQHSQLVQLTGSPKINSKPGNHKPREARVKSEREAEDRAVKAEEAL